MRILNFSSYRYSGFTAILAIAVGFASFATTSNGYAQSGAAGKSDASGVATTPPSGAPKLKPGELPPGDGKAIAEKACSVCHALNNLTDSSMSLEDWRDTVQTMMDRGAVVSKDDVDVLVKYLAKNFGLPSTAPAPASAPAAQTPPAPSTSTPAKLKPGELPPGDGKAIAEKACSVCHALNNLTDSSMSLEDWRDTVQSMIDRGAVVSKDDAAVLVKYLAKNFGPTAAPASGSSPAAH